MTNNTINNLPRDHELELKQALLIHDEHARLSAPSPTDHSEDVRAMVVPEGYKLVPIMLTPEMITVDPYGMGYGRLHAVWSRLLSASPAPGDSK